MVLAGDELFFEAARPLVSANHQQTDRLKDFTHRRLASCEPADFISTGCCCAFGDKRVAHLVTTGTAPTSSSIAGDENQDRQTGERPFRYRALVLITREWVLAGTRI